MNLYELTNYLREVEEKQDAWAAEHDGDITEFPLSAELNKISDDIAVKSVNIATWIKNHEAEADAIAEEMKRLSIRKRILENKAARLRDWLILNIPAGTKYKGACAEISWRKSERVIVPEDATKLPAIYQKVTVEAAKADIKAALKIGYFIEGCSLQSCISIQIK